MIFDINDFNKDDDYYNNFDIEPEDMGDFLNVIMTLTHSLKSLDHDNFIKSGHQLLMKVFNMTHLEANEGNEQALNVIMGLVAHTYSLISSMSDDDRDHYFDAFDKNVIYPMLGDNNG